MSQNLDLAEQCTQVSQTTNDAELREIFVRMSVLYRQLHEQEEKLADWKKRNAGSAKDFLRKPRK